MEPAQRRQAELGVNKPGGLRENTRGVGAGGRAREEARGSPRPLCAPQAHPAFALRTDTRLGAAALQEGPLVSWYKSKNGRLLSAPTTVGGLSHCGNMVATL